MSNTNRSDAASETTTVHPALSKACPTCGANAGAHCVGLGGVWEGQRHAIAQFGPMVSGPAESEYSTNSRGKRVAWSQRTPLLPTGPVVRLHLARIAKAPTKRAEKLPDAMKAGQKALSIDDSEVTEVKRPCYALITYRSMGNELVGIIAGPMSSAARDQLRSDAALYPNVVAHEVSLLSDSEYMSAMDTGRCRGVRVVTLPSQMGFVVRGEDDQDAAQDAVSAIVARRPVPVRDRQHDWLDALAV